MVEPSIKPWTTRPPELGLKIQARCVKGGKNETRSRSIQSGAEFANTTKHRLPMYAAPGKTPARLPILTTNLPWSSPGVALRARGPVPSRSENGRRWTLKFGDNGHRRSDVGNEAGLRVSSRSARGRSLGRPARYLQRRRHPRKPSLLRPCWSKSEPHTDNDHTLTAAGSFPREAKPRTSKRRLVSTRVLVEDARIRSNPSIPNLV